MKVSSIMIGVATATLFATAAAARTKEVQKVMPNGEKIICQKSEDTGSLIPTHKRCYTRADWDRIAEAARINGQRMVNDHTSGPSSN